VTYNAWNENRIVALKLENGPVVLLHNTERVRFPASAMRDDPPGGASTVRIDPV
jgi:hypothetical protein